MSNPEQKSQQKTLDEHLDLLDASLLYEWLKPKLAGTFSGEVCTKIDNMWANGSLGPLTENATKTRHNWSYPRTMQIVIGFFLNPSHIKRWGKYPSSFSLVGVPHDHDW